MFWHRSSAARRRGYFAYLAPLGTLLVVVAALSVSGRYFESETIQIYRQRAVVARNVERLKFAEGGLKIAFSPDGTLLAGVRPEPLPFVRVWTLDPERLLRIARGRVTRSLTAEECRRYLQRACAGD